MHTALLGLLAETSVHSGSGRSLGVIDLPVSREAITDYPVIPGSSLKGALRDKARQRAFENLDIMFGSPDSAGNLLASDCRLLLLPIRSLTGAMKWACCPYLIERFRRDLLRAGIDPAFTTHPSVSNNEALVYGSDTLILEERQLKAVGAPPEDIIDAIGSLLFHDATKERLKRQFVVLSDDDFRWFAQYGLPIQARNKLAENTKQSENLWYEETLPPDTIMYALVMARTPDGIDYIDNLFSEAHTPYLQLGGNETTGQGWFAVTVLKGS
ncbi:MAG: type III-B CRISPR module RAMP protein Cmr4 [Bacillota bacterium]